MISFDFLDNAFNSFFLYLIKNINFKSNKIII